MFTQLQSYIEMQVGGSAFHPFIFLLLVLGGLLASLLPCVYPLYPITAGILKARTNSVKWLHPVVYYFGLAFMYLLFGVIAGFTGGVFNTVLRYPETNIVLAYILFVLALSTAELLHLPIFGQKSANEQSSSLSGSFFLGMGAGLLSSPCVGPVVVSILLQVIATSDGVIGFFPILSTALKMFAFGLGVGLPFLGIGVFGLSLPKSGKWMRYVQIVLSLLILYFSYSYLAKAGESFEWSEFTSLKLFILWLALVAVCFFYQEHSSFISIQMKKALSLATIVLIAVIMTSVLKTGNDLTLEQAKLSEESEQIGNLKWYRNQEFVLKKAKLDGKPIFIDFYADWCTNCKEFQKLTLSDSKLNQTLKEEAILWKVEDTDAIFDTFAADSRYPELKIGLPFFLVLDKNGELIFKTNDYLAIQEMTRAIQSAK